MKIGIVGSLWLNTPPRKYGGTEDVIYNLANGLVVHGHEVTVFGPATMRVTGKMIPTVRKPLREMGVSWENTTYPLYHLTEAFDRSADFDILHVHLNKASDYIGLALAVNSKTPVVFSLHFKIASAREKPDRRMVLEKYKHLPFTTISDNQRKPLDLNYVATVYNSLDLRRFPFSERQGNYLVWLGKINPVKGTKEAILAARRAGIKIYIMGAVDKGSEEMISYYEREVKPLLDDKRAIWLEEVSHNEKTSILSGALAMLNPIKWEEPFGLVMAEAQATGTPVIAFRRGAAPEVIQNGKTGFLVDNVDEMVAKIKDVGKFSRHDCRAWVEERFTIEKMVRGYEEAYGMVIKNWKKYLGKQRRYLEERVTKFKI
jgi:glycosyltransferase involved in cell wall biosynthesis